MLPFPTNPDRQTLGQFSEAWMVAFGMVAAPLMLWRGHPTLAIAAWVAAVVGRVVGLIRPELLRVVFVGLTALTWPIGWIVSNFMLAIVYYVVVTPIGLMRRSRRRDPLGRSLNRSVASHWLEVRQNTRPDRHFRQF